MLNGLNPNYSMTSSKEKEISRLWVAEKQKRNIPTIIFLLKYAQDEIKRCKKNLKIWEKQKQEIIDRLIKLKDI